MANILFVDDDPDIGEWANTILRRNGHEVRVTSSARFVTEPKEGFPPAGAFDVAVVDMIMPEVDGIETIRALKDRCPSTRVVAISGGGPSSAADFYLRWARLFGADEALTKPFTSDELCNAIERILHTN